MAEVRVPVAEDHQGTLRTDPEHTFTMVYMQIFNYYIVETIFSGEQHLGVSDEEAIRNMTDVFLHGMLRR
jgi:hypothetical protein